MKRITALTLGLCLCISLCACGEIKENIEIAYGESYVVDNEKLEEYEDLRWESADAGIADVQNGAIIGNGPGEVLISATSDEKVVAQYTVTVNIMPATAIVLSSNSCEITEGEEYQLSYTLYPTNASNYGFSWASANESVATVDSDGKIKALSVGQTTISVADSNGIIGTCSVTVVKKPAYEYLSEKEKEFLDAFWEHLGQFKNPDSVIIKGVQKLGDSWLVKVSAQNGFGGNSISTYYLTDSGFYDFDDYDVDLGALFNPDSTYNVELLNEALKCLV